MSTRIPLSPEDEKSVLLAIENWKPRDRCLIQFGLNTGYRASELGSITVGQVWDGARARDEITINRRDMKGGKGFRRAAVRSRTVPLNAAAKAAIEGYLRLRISHSCGHLDAAEPLFRSIHTGRGLTRWRINIIVRRAAIEAGLRSISRYGSHTLRKTFAHRIYRASGHDINLTRAALGHRSILVTQSYLQIDQSDLRSTIMAIGT